MEQRKMRNSNIELLRNVAMFMIVLYHIVCHCVVIQLTDRGSMERLANGLFNYPLFYKKLLILDTMQTFGIVGNVVFILISGYFMIQKKTDIDIVKISKKLLFQLGFATVVLTVASTVCFHMNSGTFLNLMDIQYFNSMSWFAGYYYIIILIAKVFLNGFLERVDNKGYLSFLIATFALSQFGWTGGLADGLIPGLRTLLTGIFLYALGGYFKIYDPLRKLRTYVFFLAIFITYFFVNLSAYNITETNIENYIRNQTEEGFIQYLPGYPNHSIVVIIIGVCLFEIFKRIRIPQSRILNYLGQATFMVYLVHDNEFFYSIYNMKDWITLLYYRPFGFLLQIFIWSGGVFLFGVAVYTFYILLAKLFAKYKWVLFKEGMR